jgi:tRNA G37 N-methylase TrmD
MLMRPEPVFACVEAVDPPRPLFLLGPAGRRFDQALAEELASGQGFSLLCGRYEGVDHRVREHLVDDELSVGDVVLAGGEVAACLVIEAVTRLLPGVMGNAVSPQTESFGATGLPSSIASSSWMRSASWTSRSCSAMWLICSCSAPQRCAPRSRPPSPPGPLIDMWHLPFVGIFVARGLAAQLDPAMDWRAANG